MRQFLTKRKLTSLGVFAAAVIGVAVFLATTGGPAVGVGVGVEARPLPVAVVGVEPETGYAVARAYTGRIEARRTSVLGFERSAEVVEVAVQEGVAVERGDTLARLDTRQLEARKRQLVAERDAAQATLDELVAGPRAEDVAEARAEVARQTAVVERTRIRTDRVRNLHARSAANDDELDEAVFDLQAAEASLDAAKARLLELENGTRPEQLASQRARVAQLDASLAAVDVDLEDSVLVAPFAGTVQRRAVDEGAVVSPGQAVVTLVQGGLREAWIGLPVDAAAGLVVGETMTLDVGGRSVEGVVKSVLPTLNRQTRTVDAIFEVNGSLPKAPGQIVRLTLPERVEQAGFWLPTSALSRGTRGLWSAFVVGVGERIERLDLEVLHTESDRVYVRGGASAGDRVVADGTHRLAAGQRVEVSLGVLAAEGGER